MLRSLYVRDYALIEELEVTFGSGLNVITGETGAGKSILLGALKLILGERASMEYVRTGARKAVVEGVFETAGGSTVEELLRENEIDVLEDGSVIVRREVSGTHSRAFINDTPTTLNVLRDVAERLIDLHGQHEHQSLLREELHIEIIDAFGQLEPLVEQYRAAYVDVDRLEKKRHELIRQEQELRQQKDLVEFQIGEIDAIAPVVGEEEGLIAERRILDNAEYLHTATGTLVQLLYEGDSTLIDRISAVVNELRDLQRIDESFSETVGEVDQAAVILREAARLLQEYHARVEADPERLEEVRERLAALDNLKRKYGGSLEAVLKHREKIGETLDLASNFDGMLARLTADIDQAKQKLTETALRLSDERKAVAKKVEPLIVAELAELGMPHSRFEVVFAVESQTDGWIAHPDGPFRALAEGIDIVAFHLTTNPGEPLRPLVRIASGGEISRIMLALKSILAKTGRLPILVFDEIDVGISGEMARRVGQAMHRLARSHQIVAITHLPQIAALGDQHFVVEKRVEESSEGPRTATRLCQVDGEERIRSIATLVAGENLTEAALAGARELLGER